MYLLGAEELAAVKRVIDSGRLYRYHENEATESNAFEREWAEKIGSERAILMSSGTAALICGLVGMGVGPADEVLVPAYTFMATPLAVLAVGAVPIIVEIDETLTIDTRDLERKITSSTRAVIPVHMCGFQCDMDTIMELAAKHQLGVLEDACQADGGSYKGRRLGSIGDAGAFSFNEFKIITCGEGGALVTNNREIYERATIYHDGGCAQWDHDQDSTVPLFAGVNYRINEISSAILRVQLKRLDSILASLRKEKLIMLEELRGELRDAVFNPVLDEDGDCGTNLALLFETPGRANQFVTTLQEHGINIRVPLGTGRHVYVNWEPILQKRGAHHPALDGFRLSKNSSQSYSPDMCPETLAILKRTAFLETSATRTEAELMCFVDSIKKALRSACTRAGAGERLC